MAALFTYWCAFVLLVVYSVWFSLRAFKAYASGETGFCLGWQLSTTLCMFIEEQFAASGRLVWRWSVRSALVRQTDTRAFSCTCATSSFVCFLCCCCRVPLEGPVRAIEGRAGAVDQEDQRVGHFGLGAGGAGARIDGVRLGRVLVLDAMLAPPSLLWHGIALAPQSALPHQ